MKDNDILNRSDRNDGMNVPDGYFKEFVARMEQELPVQDWEREAAVVPRSFWQKVRPYVYLAAMFLGVWCMMNMVDLMRPDSTGLSIDSNPVLTAAINNDSFINDYFIYQSEVDDTYLLDDLYTVGYEPEMFSDTVPAEEELIDM